MAAANWKLWLGALILLSCGKLGGDQSGGSGTPKNTGATKGGAGGNGPSATTEFKLLSVTPAEESKAVGRANRIEVEFNEELAPELQNEAPQLLKIQDGPGAFLAGTYEVEGGVLRFLPAAAMKADKSHVVNLKGKIRSKSGKDLEVSKNWKFQTSLTNDISLPTLMSTFPSQTGEWAFGTPFLFYFDEVLQADSLKSDINVFDTNGAKIAAKTRLVSNTLLVDLEKALPEGPRELRFVAKVWDLDGNQRTLDKRLSFVVKSQLPEVALTLVSVSPDSPTDRKVREDLTIKFNRPLDPTTVSGASLWLENSATGAKATADFVLDGDSIKMKFGAGLNYSTSYEVVSSGALKSVTGGAPLATAETPLSNFTTQTALALSSGTPAPAATNVSLGTLLQLNFSKALVASTFTKDTVEVRDDFGNKVLGEWAIAGNTAQFSGVFTKSKSYKLKLTSAVRAEDDSSFAADVEHRFSMAKDTVWESTAKVYVSKACSTCHASFLDRDIVVARKAEIYSAVNGGSMPKAPYNAAPHSTDSDRNAFKAWLQTLP